MPSLAVTHFLHVYQQFVYTEIHFVFIWLVLKLLTNLELILLHRSLQMRYCIRIVTTIGNNLTSRYL